MKQEDRVSGDSPEGFVLNYSHVTAREEEVN